ncbi:helix-turn-helix domain-containing protein [Segatella copri]|uniref:helix-turn-helix domain-containing protein n=1 Tax=Segatella copri TaxID=165179 RepID=UPI0011827FD2
MDLKKSFAQRLHNARLMRGLSMQQLCDMMGNIITKQTLFKYEKGVMLPKSGIVIALCDALEITPDYLNMKKIILFLLAILYVGICKAQLSAADCKYVLEIFCRNYYGSCFDGKTYVHNTIIITSVGIDQNSGGTFVSGLHSYQGQYIPFRGRKTHTNVQFNAVIVRQPKRDYVVFNKWYEPDMLNRKGGWETGQRLITYK